VQEEVIGVGVELGAQHGSGEIVGHRRMELRIEKNL